MASVFASLSSFLACLQLILGFPLWFSMMARVDGVNVNRSEEVSTLLNFRNANTAVLATLYNGYWITWKESDDNPCAWIGVTCTPNFTVEELNFSGWGLSFRSMEALYSLRDLRHLDLSSNSLSYLPDDIGNFTGLTWLDLSRNGFAHMPFSISACTNLRFLGLGQNQIIEVPPGTRNLVNLQFLNLADNLIRGPFPTTELGELSTLVSLDLSRNFFTGTIPALPNLTNLVGLNLDNNLLTGFEEPWFLGTKNLQHLSVVNNALEGWIPSNISNFEYLVVLNMSRNNLTGTIPSGFSLFFKQMTNGFSLDLSQNQLTGEIPPDMLQQTYPNACSSVNLSHNLLTGNVPIDRYRPFCFSVLDLSHNNLSGPIPSITFSQPNTTVSLLWLRSNYLSGDIIDIFFGPGFKNTKEVRLDNNLFTGDLSRMANTSLELGLLNLVGFDLSNNRLQWSISEAVPDPILATLEVLTSNAALREFRVGGNDFLGTSLPTGCFDRANALQVLDLSNCHLDGKILSNVFNNTCLPSLQSLNIANNYISGPVPDGIVTNTNATGPGLRLEVLDVSNNNLSGHLPSIPRSSSLYNPMYFAGNGGLCGDPLPPCSKLAPKQGIGLQWWALLIICGGCLAIALGSCLAATCRWRVYQKRHQQDADLIRTLLERDSAALISLRELKKATDNFAESAQIGEGGFGTVYIGKLNDGTVVAIKRSKREGSEKDKEQFLNEVRILSQVNHRHLVKLLGCSMENKIAVLVFEFISNGTLQQHLQGNVGASHLSWKQRLTIAVQTADALNYLHSAAASPIFHRDVKSANILLNENLDAKVADFGISKLAPLHATHVSTAAVQGTLGYIDPEYYTSYKLTDKSDVYSFGVVLLELISAKQALDFRRRGDETSLVNLARPDVERGDLEEFIDPVLIETYRDPTHHGKESILNVGRLAMKCLDMRSKGRPSMKEVLNELQNFWLIYSGTFKNLDSINEDDSNDLGSSNALHLSNSFSGNSSTFSVQSAQENDGSGIEMSSLSPFPTLQ